MWQDLVITLLHTLWQGALAAGVLFVVLRRVSADRPGARYAAALASMGAIVIAACVTWSVRTGAWESHSTQLAIMHAQPIVVHEARGEWTGVVETSRGEAAATFDWARWAARAWMAGVVVMLVRAGVLVCDANGLRRRCRAVEDGTVRRLVDELAAQMGIRRRVKVAEGDGLRVPCVLGAVWPAVLLPAALASGVSAAELRMLFAHELAHVKRYDYLVNLLQMLVEAVLFFNPAVWWVSRQVRIEREACCDAIAVRVTREPVRYAEVLAEWARGTTPAAAMGASGDGKSGGLADRVYRILKPGYRPEVRMGVGKLVVVMVLGMGLMAGVWRGTDAAVALAAEVLSPAERTARIEREAQRVMPVDMVGASDSPKHTVAVSGRVLTPDGKPAKSGWIYARIEAMQHSTRMTLGSLKDGVFSGTVPPGVIYFEAEVDGYAPAEAGPFKSGPEGKVEGVEIPLTPGFDGRVALVDDAGGAVPNAKVEGYIERRGGGMIHEWASDGRGIVTIAHAADRPYTLRSHIPGYESAELDHARLTKDGVVRWVLRKARPTDGVVVTEKGDPVAGATLRVFGGQLGDSVVEMNGWDGPVAAKTDARGAFLLDTLRQGAQYTILVEAAGGKMKLLRGVKSGQAGLKVVMADGIRVAGRIVGDLGKKPVVTYSESVSVLNNTYGSRQHEAPVSADGKFEIANLVPGNLSLSAGGRYVAPVELKEGELPDEVVIDLRANAGPAKRKAVFVFKPQRAGVPAPTGTVMIQCNLDGPPAAPALSGNVMIRDGRAEADAYVGGRMMVIPQQLVGGWFAERFNIDVPAGEGPFEVEVPVIEAGAIVGRVADEDGKPSTDQVNISVNVLERSNLVPETANWSGVQNVRPVDGEFVASPLPLGGTYVVQAHRGHTYVLSEPIKVDEKTPMPRVELKMVKGVKAVVEVYDWNGRRLAGVPVDFGYNSPFGGHGFSPLPVTNETGRCVFEGINPDAPGPKDGLKYTVSLQPRVECQPTKPVELRLDGTPTTITLAKGNVLEGRVMELGTNLPLEGAEVVATPVGGYRFQNEFQAEGRTDREGKFRFSTLGTGTYSIHVKESGVWAANENLVDAGKDNNVDLHVPVPAWNQKMVVKAKQ